MGSGSRVGFGGKFALFKSPGSLCMRAGLVVSIHLIVELQRKVRQRVSLLEDEAQAQS